VADPECRTVWQVEKPMIGLLGIPRRVNILPRNPTRLDRIVAYSTAIGAVGTFLAILAALYIAHEQSEDLRKETRTQLTEAREEAKIQHLEDEVRKFDQPPLLDSRKTLAAQRIDSKHKTLRHLDIENPPPEMWDLLGYCDHVGLLTRRGYLDVTDVWNEFGYWFFPIYADARPAIDVDRKESPASMNECSWLIEAMRPIELKENAGAQDHPSQDDLYEFYEGEVDAKPGALTAHRVK
jgi:hypothetical protein